MKYINKLLPFLLISLFIVSCSYKAEIKEQNTLQNNVSVTLKVDTTKYNRMINPTEKDLERYHKNLYYVLTYYKNESGITDDSKKKLSLTYNDLEEGFFIDGLTAEEWFFELKGSDGFNIYCTGSTTRNLKFGNNTVCLLLNDEFNGDEEDKNGYLDVSIFTLAYDLDYIYFYLCKYDENSQESYGEWLGQINIVDTNTDSYYKKIIFEKDSNDPEIPDDLKKMGLSAFTYKYYPANSSSNDVEDHLIKLPSGFYFIKMSFKSYEYDGYISDTCTNVVQISEPVRILPSVTTTYNTINRLDVSRIEYDLGEDGTWSDEDLFTFKDNHYDMCVRNVTIYGNTYENKKYIDLIPTSGSGIFMGWEYDDGTELSKEEDDDGNDRYYITTQDFCTTIKIKARWQ